MLASTKLIEQHCQAGQMTMSKGKERQIKPGSLERGDAAAKTTKKRTVAHNEDMTVLQLSAGQVMAVGQAIAIWRMLFHQIS